MLVAMTCAVGAANANDAARPPLIASPKEWLKQLHEISGGSLSRFQAEEGYFRMLAGLLTGAALVCDPAGSPEAFAECYDFFRLGIGAPTMKMKRAQTTMTGVGRLANVQSLVQQVAKAKLAGGYLEAGVWRGGNSIMAVASLQLAGLGAKPVYLCDSFHGLPKSREGSIRPKEGNMYQRMNSVLSVSAHRVLDNFDRFSIARDNVTLVPGYFVDSLPPLRAQLLERKETLAILRMDGDMYDSTIDILYNLYDLVTVGGYIIVDDFGWSAAAVKDDPTWARPMFGAKQALLDFRKLHGISEPMKDIDGAGAYFQKTHEVELRRSTYQLAVQSKTTKANTNLTASAVQDGKMLTRHDYYNLMKEWEATRTVEETTRVGHARGLIRNQTCAGAPGATTVPVARGDE